MGYAIALALVLLVVGVAVTLFVMRAASNRGPKGASDSDSTSPGTGEGEQTPFDGDTEAPAGDTSQHSGESSGGQTVAGYDAQNHGGAGRRSDSYDQSGAVGQNHDDPHEAAHIKRPGEAEGAARF